MRRYAGLLCLVCITMSASMDIRAQKAKDGAGSSAKAAERSSALTIDTHADTPQRILDMSYDLDSPLGSGQWSLPTARQGGLGAEFFSIWVEPQQYKGQEVKRALELIDSVYQQAAIHPDQMEMAFTAADIVRVHRQRKLAVLLGLEGGHAIDNSLGILRDYYRLGVRYMTLTWTNSNGWADSSGDADDHKMAHTETGLSEFGKDVVYQMNRMGMMVDVSHVSDKTLYRTLIVTRAPVIASHSGARALCGSPRNMTDDMLRAVARNGGVVQVNFYSVFISERFRSAWNAQTPVRQQAKDAALAKAKATGQPVPYAEYDRIDREFAAKIPRPPLRDLIDQIDHVAKVAGIDHVGLGSDFDGVSSLPEGIDSPADLPKIAAALEARGHTAADMKKLLGGNLLRVLRQAEQTAKDMQANAPAERPRILERQPGD
ncbi:MAG: dipeptidase [Acidobacteriaceae bacterium]